MQQFQKRNQNQIAIDSQSTWINRVQLKCCALKWCVNMSKPVTPIKLFTCVTILQKEKKNNRNKYLHLFCALYPMIFQSAVSLPKAKLYQPTSPQLGLHLNEK